MLRPPSLLRAALLACALGHWTLVLGHSAPAAATSAAWDLLSRLQTADALGAFAAAEGEEARLGEAVALLNLQPKTQANVRRAEELLSALAGRAESPQAPAARYHLARLFQLHASPARPAEAEAAYRELIASYPGNPYADAAIAKLAIIVLHQDIPRAEWDARFAELVALLPDMASPEALRDARLVLAGAALRMHADHALALPFFIAALESGVPLRVNRHKIVLLQAAESARLLGDIPRALAFYEDFVRAYPFDVRGHEIRQVLASLRQSAAAATR